MWHGDGGGGVNLTREDIMYYLMSRLLLTSEELVLSRDKLSNRTARFSQRRGCSTSSVAYIHVWKFCNIDRPPAVCLPAHSISLSKI